MLSVVYFILKIVLLYIKCTLNTYQYILTYIQLKEEEKEKKKTTAYECINGSSKYLLIYTYIHTYIHTYIRKKK